MSGLGGDKYGALALEQSERQEEKSTETTGTILIFLLGSHSFPLVEIGPHAIMRWSKKRNTVYDKIVVDHTTQLSRYDAYCMLYEPTNVVHV